MGALPLAFRAGPQRPERSVVEKSAVVLPKPPHRATTTLPFVISTGAKRSGEICGSSSQTSAPCHNDPPLCHLDRSEAQWRDLRYFFLNLCTVPQRPSPLSSRPERSAVERSAFPSSSYSPRKCDLAL